MHRFRFYVTGEDGRPAKFPPSGPYWVSGRSGDRTIVVAFCKDLATLTNHAHWPNAENVTDYGERDIVFTDRFPRPEWWVSATDILAQHHTKKIAPLRPKTFQDTVREWTVDCFGVEVADDKHERCARFLEEALELCQSLSFPREDAIKLIDYVYGRDPGRPSQEVGGTCLTLASLCAACDIDMLGSSVLELNRVNHPDIIERVRQKNASKPRNSPLPGAPDSR